MVAHASQRLDGERYVVDNHSSTKAERTKDVATKSSDAGFFGGMFLGLMGGMVLGGMLTLMALVSIPR
jgi:predicted lipid-binding transport protein (Tim44 family)